MALCENGCGKDAGIYKKTANGNRIGTPKRFCSYYCTGRALGKRNVSKPAHNFGDRTTHCKCGLPRTPENTTKHGYCLVCAREAQSRWKRRNPNAGRYRHYPSRYGVTPEQFIAEMEKQQGKCRVCKVILSHDSVDTTPTLDHVHDASKRFRGVLCPMCNTGLGLFRDTPEFLQSAIQYLKETQ
jgi:hypothetical protein